MSQVDAKRRRNAEWMRVQRRERYRSLHSGLDEPRPEDVLAVLRQVYIDLHPESRASASAKVEALKAKYE